MLLSFVAIHADNVLQRCGFNPSGVLDVGANVGDWTHSFQKGMFRNAKFFMIEGNENCRGDLQKRNVPFEISLVGNFEGNITYYKSLLSKTGTGNSLYLEDTPAFKGDKFEKVVAPINTIDNIVRKHGVGPFQFMKMDIQGAELDGLRGAQETLKSVEVRSYLCADINLSVFGFILLNCALCVYCIASCRCC